MKEQTLSLVPTSNVTVVPFGIDTGVFSKAESRPLEKGEVVVGTVKTLAPKYGIDILIRAFALAREDLRESKSEEAVRLRLLIVGGGPDETKLKILAEECGVADVSTFSGRVPHEEVPEYLHQMDVYVAVSRSESESFGVAVIEASACGLPVIVSDVGGLPEVVVVDRTGLIVRREDVSATAQAISRLVQDRNLRQRMGLQGRLHVEENYEWTNNVSQMEEVYFTTIELAGRSKRS
jgi:glycosyltransferase involved in cell wall biosynthesis